MAPAIRTALIGFGLGGRVFAAPFLEADRAYSLKAIVTSNPAQASAAAVQYPGARILPTASQVLSRSRDLDLVVLATPPETHPGLGAAVLAAGLHLVIDKPFVLHTAEGETLLAQARAADRLLTVYHHRRWDSDFLTVKRVIRSGALGEVREFAAHFDWWRPSGVSSWGAEHPVTRSGEMLADLGTHLIDQAIQLFGPVEEATGGPAAGESGRVDDEVHVLLRHASGIRSHLTMDPLPNMPVPRFRVVGTAATYEKWGLDPQASDIEAGVLPTHPEFGRESREEWGRIITRDAVHSIEPERGSYGEFFRLLARAIRGEGPIPVDPEDALEVVRLIERIRAGA